MEAQGHVRVEKVSWEFLTHSGISRGKQKKDLNHPEWAETG